MLTTGTTTTNRLPNDFGWANDEWSSGPSPKWREVKSYVTPPLAVAAATPLAFPLLERKTAQQLRQKRIGSVWQSFARGFGAAPLLGATIGFQLAAQKGFEYYMFKVRNREPTDWETAASTVMAAAATAHFLAGFNGLTAGKALLESMHLSPRQFAMILGRESTFLGAMVVTPQVAERVKDKFGDSWVTRRCSAFAAGVVGASMGHFGDTGLTWAQNRRPKSFTKFSPETLILKVLPRGIVARGAAVGLLNMQADALSELLNSLDKEQEDKAALKA